MNGPAPASKAPTPKVAAAGTGGAAAAVLVTIAQAFGVDLPPEAAAGIVALVAFAAGYLKRS